MFYKKNIFGDFSSCSDDSLIRQERNDRKIPSKNCSERVKLATSRLPLDIKRLLTEQIDSVNQLEVLLVFFNNKSRSWNANTMSHELRSHETITKHQLQKLCEDGFLKDTGNGEYTYAPTEELDQKVELLNVTYKEMPVAVIAFIYEKPTDKLKGFADAFKLKKD